MGLWVKPNNSQPKSQPLVDKSDNNQVNYRLLLTPDNTVRLIMQADNCSTSESIGQRHHRQTEGQWNHVMGTLDGTTMRLYINGVADANTRRLFRHPCLTAAEIRIGGQSCGGWSAFDGEMDEVTVYGDGLERQRSARHL